MSDRLATVLKGGQVLYRRRRMAETVFPKDLPEGEPEAATAGGEMEPQDPAGEVQAVPDLEALELAFQQRLAQAVEEARQEGYREGLQEIRPLADMLEKLLQELKEARHQLLEGAELTVVRLAYEIAKKILHREVTESADAIVYVVREALKRIADRDKIVLRVHPEDARTLQAASELHEDLFGTFAKVEVREDEDISRGGCLVETSSGLIDATLETQLAEVEAALFGDA